MNYYKMLCICIFAKIYSTKIRVNAETALEATVTSGTVVFVPFIFLNFSGFISVRRHQQNVLGELNQFWGVRDTEKYVKLCKFIIL